MTPLFPTHREPTSSLNASEETVQSGGGLDDLKAILMIPKTSLLFQCLNEIRDKVHDLAKEKGWHSFEGETDQEFITRSVANFHGEVSELWEAFRKSELTKECDKGNAMAAQKIHPISCEEEELADIIIRVLDYAGRRCIDIGAAVQSKHLYNATRAFRHGDKKA